MTESIDDLCKAPMHPQAAQGLRLFNAGKYFEAHEALEIAWLEEQGKVRELYRGILQIAVVYLTATRRDYNGVIKVYGRSQKWLKDWPETCRGINVGQLQRDAKAVINEIERLGSENISRFDNSLLRPAQWNENIAGKNHIYMCDR